MRKYLNLLFTLFIVSNLAVAQEYPQDFRPPLDLTPRLSGNFAELRGFHFHSGIDIKTNQTEGHNVYAIGEGYVSRVKISPRGYGNAIYVTHPNGYTSVYAHLQKYVGEIANYIRNEQYKQQKFAIDIEVPQEALPVKKGEVIGLSGNSGSSFGPHLHFEIRDTQTEETINPFYFGFDVSDTRAPEIRAMYVYALEGDVAGKKRYTLSGARHFKSPLYAAGPVGIGIKAYDKHNGANNSNGVHKIEVFSNQEKIFTYTASKFRFDETRYINSLTDYEQYMTNKGWIYQCYRDPGNKLRMIEDLDNGIIYPEEGKTYHIDIKVTDYAGNVTTGSMVIVGKKFNPTQKASQTKDMLYWNKENHIQKDEVELWLPAESIYEDLPFNYKKENGKYYIMNDKIPLHKYYTLAISPEDIPPHLLSKAVIAVKYNWGGRWNTDYFPTEYKNGKLVAEVRDFGIFVTEIDDKKPSIYPINVKENATFTARNGRMKFKVKDSQTGIHAHDAYIDGKWVLTSYDKKNDLVVLDLNQEEISIGTHTLEFKVTDGKNNVATYKVRFKKAS